MNRISGIAQSGNIPSPEIDFFGHRNVFKSDRNNSMNSTCADGLHTLWAECNLALKGRNPLAWVVAPGWMIRGNLVFPEYSQNH